jgi:hypothetical protein
VACPLIASLHANTDEAKHRPQKRNRAHSAA